MLSFWEIHKIISVFLMAGHKTKIIFILTNIILLPFLLENYRETTEYKLHVYCTYWKDEEGWISSPKFIHCTRPLWGSFVWNLSFCS